MAAMSDKGVFVTGTDTAVGKTIAACGMLAARRGLRSIRRNWRSGAAATRRGTRLAM